MGGARSDGLPLTSGGLAVDKIVCFTDFDIDAREWRRFFEESAKPPRSDKPRYDYDCGTSL
ncbi:MAG: hypothetical protein RLO05_00530 [Rhodospirillales bacterium]